jgi:nicotinate phosphoribosyltransferase
MNTNSRSRSRLPSYVFDLPVQELRRGYRSDVYFWRAKVALEKKGLHPAVTMQVFQKKEAVLCGIDEALAILRLAAGRYRNAEKAFGLFDQLIELKQRIRRSFLEDSQQYVDCIQRRTEITRQLDDLWESGYDSLSVEALHDGDQVTPWESVMHIRGDYSLFAHLETLYLGALARRTRIATNVSRVVHAAAGKPVLYFPARFDHWAVQGGDGYAAHIGGASGVSTDAQGEWWGVSGAGTVPHALIAAMKGSTVDATRLFYEAYPDVNLIALVDFENDVVKTSLECARAMGERLWGVRVDTSETMVDRSMIPEMGMFRPNGVSPRLIEKLRTELDKNGFQHVKVVVSGGFTAERIRAFEQQGVPADVYGVGTALIQGQWDFTADVVETEGIPCAKTGRRFQANPRFCRVTDEDFRS